MKFNGRRGKITRPWNAFLGLVLVGSFCGIQLLQAQFRGFGGNGANGQTRQYLNNTQVGDALIEVDPETRSVIVITDEETNLQIDKVLQNLDRPKPQVLIKVVFMEVTHRDDLDVGLEGNLSFSSNSGDQSNLVQSAFGMSNQNSGGLYQMVDDSFDLTLRAMAEDGRVEVLSRPSILARNNQEAIITVGQTVPFIDNVTFSQVGQQINTVTYRDIGIILRVTPFITQNGMVEMIVGPEISTITDETVTIQEGVEAPVFAKRAAETVVVTPHGKTVIIGGLMEKNKIESQRKIPLLGDIPVLGWAFRRTVKEDTKTELLIFLTPYIVQDPSQLGEMTAMETGDAELPAKAFEKKDLDRFLGDVEGLEAEDATEENKSSRRIFFRRNP